MNTLPKQPLWQIQTQVVLKSIAPCVHILVGSHNQDKKAHSDFPNSDNTLRTS